MVKALKVIIVTPGSLWSKLGRHKETGFGKYGSLTGVQTGYFSHATLQD
jgi:hypothetical protein